MTESHRVTLIAPSQVSGGGESGPYPFELFHSKCLAQGDSWFSIGSIPPGLTSNILAQLDLTHSVVVVNCARPGKELVHMTDSLTEPAFLRLITGPLALRWDAILVSGGGNDLIDAARSPPDAPQALRLFSTPAERAAGGALPDAYLSEPGWQTFAGHLGTVFAQLVALRDESGQNQRVPLVLHTYAHLMPRPAPAGPRFGPWLQPALDAFGVPRADHLAVSNLLIDRLAALLQSLIDAQRAADPACAIFLVDSRTAPLVLGAQDDTGPSGDSQNEIHPTRGGYTKLAAVWRQTLDNLV